MSIKSIEIKNFKSIDYLKMNISELNAFVGKNGTGKSTIQNAIKYFYNNLVEMRYSDNEFDTVNKLKDTIEISVEYDFSKIFKYAPENYSSKLFSMLPFFSETITVKMTQKKNKMIDWNLDYDERYIIYNSHPIYFCDTRSVDLTNWDSLWEIVGDLINAREVNNIIGELSDKLSNKEFKHFNEYEKIFKNFLENNEFTIRSETKKNRVISLLQLQLGGKTFLNKNERLEYFSDGTNSQSYILFLAYIAFEISNKRLKEATVFLDEPELGLHPKMIDQLMEKLVKYSESVRFIIFSHSPRLIAAVVKGKGELNKVYLKNKYTYLTNIVKLRDKKYQLVVTEREASCYFSDLSLFVEGVSELELFTHSIIIKLFPFLKRVDVINTSSNDHLLKLFHSINPKIPYLILNDMDKIIKFTNISKQKYKIQFTGLWYSPIQKKEKKERLQYSYAKDIDNRLKYSYAKKNMKVRLKLKEDILIELDKPVQVIGDLKVIESNLNVIQKIQNFCLYYNLFLVRNTIEGTIINEKSYRVFNRWRKSKINTNNNDISKLLDQSSKSERIVILRLLFSGKLDTLDKYKEEDFPEKYKVISENMTSKNTEWITQFFDYYEINILNQKQYSKDNNNRKKIQRFSQDFPELYDIIESVRKRISDE